MRAPARTYVTGISNGGYLTRWQLENRPDLYDGGVDWEGTLFDSAPGLNLLSFLPPALKNFPRYRATGDAAAHDAIIAAGFAPGSEFLWDDHYAVYWDLTQRTYREAFDPGYDGTTDAGRSRLHRYYTIEGGNHVDDRADTFPGDVRPILPCYREAFLRLTSWVTDRQAPPATQTVARQASGDEANTCPQLAATSAGPGSGHGGGS